MTKSHLDSKKPKRPYLAPVLKAHGNLRTLTAAKGGSSNDGSGKPRTKTSGGSQA